MDITLVKNNQYKIRGKKGYANVVVGESVEIVASNSKDSFVINQPGEYEVEGISVFAYPANDRLATLVEVEDVKVLVVDELIKENVIEDMDTVDVIVLGVGVVGSKELIEMVGKIEPSYVVPEGETARVEAFVKDFEHNSRTESKLSISKSTMAADVTDVVILSK